MNKVEQARWERYAHYRNTGDSIDKAAKKARLSTSTAYRFEAGDPASSGIEAMAKAGINTVGGKLIALPLSVDAQRALDDFAYFRLRYFGRSSTPWQERAAYEVLRAHETGDREYVVMNEPPGSGKSTLFTHDIPCWLIARDRSIRIMIGSVTGTMARMYLRRIKRTLERDTAIRANADDLASGAAIDAAACMSEDFGPFKPESRSQVWTASQITVRQLGEVDLDNKEPTCSAWGRDEGFLGGRFDVVVWDDLVTRKSGRTEEAFKDLTEWWTTEAETRLEPGGLLLLQGQRIAADDLYRYCLDMTNADETPKYRHIVYAAHDDQRCTGVHDDTARAWPDGCLLDPVRIPWSALTTLMRNNRAVYDIQYQQGDGEKVGQLVESAWLSGGPDSSGLVVPGCYDTDRSIGEIHPLDADDGWSIVSVDPSPTNWWGIGWWVMRPEVNRYILMDCYRAKMGSQDFLSMNLDDHTFSGLLEDLRVTAANIGQPITHVIVEYNAAQRYLVTQPHVQRWQSAHGITVIPHQTQANKNDPKYGVTSLADYFRQGAIRLPFADPSSRMAVGAITAELTRWPNSRTDDQVMMVWFAMHAVLTNYTPAKYRAPKQQRPDWVSNNAHRGLPSSRPKETAMDRLAARLGA